jgi:nitric oxide reductase NorD protein
VRQVLAAAPHDASGGDGEPPDDATPDDVCAWARRTAAALLDAVDTAPAARRYRGLAPVAAWGTLDAAPAVAVAPDPPITTGPHRSARRTRRASCPSGAASAGVPRARASVWTCASPTPTRRRTTVGPTLDDPRGAPSAEAGRSAAARTAGDRAPAGPPDDVDPAAPGAREYPEWDARARRLVPRAVRVVVPPPTAEDAAWAARALGEHAGVVRLVRERFERLRPRRARLPRQRDGAELDLDACVRALVAGRVGDAPDDDRLYVAVRPARRAVAFAVLVDVSGSTEAPASPSHQVIDVEKRAALLAAEALDALGDPFALLAFSSYGARHVEVTTLKAFGEPHGARTRGRVGALRPGGSTRLGAALRHATALLARQPRGTGCSSSSPTAGPTTPTATPGTPPSRTRGQACSRRAPWASCRSASPWTATRRRTSRRCSAPPATPCCATPSGSPTRCSAPCASCCAVAAARLSAARVAALRPWRSPRRQRARCRRRARGRSARTAPCSRVAGTRRACAAARGRWRRSRGRRW